MSGGHRPDVLCTIVSKYVHTRGSVDSKAIVQQHDIGVSFAMVCNGVALFGGVGLIHRPHTSTGRAPTDKGHRIFVDSLASVKSVSGPERNAAESFLTDPCNTDEVVAKIVHLLAQVTCQVAIVECPTLVRERLRRCELVDLGPRLPVTVVTLSGHVKERMLGSPAPLTPEMIIFLHEQLNALWEGCSAEEILPRTDEALPACPPAQYIIAKTVCTALVDLLRVIGESKITIAEMSNLARGTIDFRDIAPLLDTLEEQVVLMKLFAELGAGDDIHVLIGAKNPCDALIGASTATGAYRFFGQSGDGLAHLDIVGPTRMDYARTMSAVRAVVAYLTRFLDR